MMLLLFLLLLLLLLLFYLRYEKDYTMNVVSMDLYNNNIASHCDLKIEKCKIIFLFAQVYCYAVE